MTNPDLQPGKPVQTRSGLEAVIYAVYEGQEYPIHAAYKSQYGGWVVIACRADGGFCDASQTSGLDIIPAPKKLTGFINVYPCSAHPTRKEADKMAACFDHATGFDRIACIDLAEHSLNEGHGLTEGSSDE